MKSEGTQSSTSQESQLVEAFCCLVDTLSLLWTRIIDHYSMTFTEGQEIKVVTDYWLTYGKSVERR